jgi:NADH-quinone oxidoreductase subunit F
MDLKAIATPPSDAERAAVDGVLGPAPAKEAPIAAGDAAQRRTQLLPVLLALQGRVGWVSPGGLGYACARLGVAPAEGYGVASFYALLSLEPRPTAFAHVCDDVACKLAGAEKLCARLGERLGPGGHPKEHAGGLEVPRAALGPPPRWARSPCLGLCEQGPAALVTVAGAPPREQAFGHATAESIERALGGETVAAEVTHVGSAGPRKLLARAGRVNPASLDDYRANGGYTALRRALELGPEGVLREVTESKLVGRGGAAFPTGRKWEAVARAPVRPRYVACNADESEPGTFKDRVLLEQDPFGLVEAMTIAGYAMGAEKGFIYLRGEYPLAHARLSSAIAAARTRGLLGSDIMGRGFTFDLELRSGAGAYICGEETALFESIEGYRGEPRTKPPFPVLSGLFGKPTAINNVETLVAALDIVRDGAAAYASVGTGGSPGTKLFCISGRVAMPGVYEVPFGTKLSELLALAGGVPGGKQVKAVLLGGAAGTFVGPGQLELKLSFEDARAAGTTLGSGVVMVLDETDSLTPLLQRIAAFFRDESCGQCVPCRVGTVKQEELLARLAAHRPMGSVAQELALYKELAQAMKDASICGLGQTATSAIESALALSPFEEQR